MQSTHSPAGPAVARRARLRMICPAYPALNIYSRPARVMTALGPVYVATAAADVPGWDAEIIDENNYRRGPADRAGRPDHAAIQQARPADVVGLYGGLTSTVPRLLELARLYRGMGVRTVAGGNHFADENIEQALRSGVDVVVLGEGEETIVELLTCFGGGGRGLSSVRGIAFLEDGQVVRTAPREPIADLDRLPLPDFSVLRNAVLKCYPISTTRGCAMHCEFCAVKGKPRCGSPERMLEQFASIYERWGGTQFFVTDDLFGQDRPAAIRLCGLLRDYQRRAGVRFLIMVQIRLDRARDGELLAAMRQAGINFLAIGYESPIAEELKAMDKHLNPQEMINLTRTYRQAGFRIHGMFIFGYPARKGQSFTMSAADRVRHFRRFIRRARIDTVQVLLPIPLPGTALADRMRQENRILPPESVGLEYYDGNFPLLEPDPPLTPESLQASAQELMRRFYGWGRAVALIVNLLSFPAITLYCHRIKSGWRHWRHRLWTSLYRTGGWLLLRQWTAAFRRDGFRGKLAAARQNRFSAGGTDLGAAK